MASNTDIQTPLLELNDGTKIPLLAYGTGTAWFKQSGGSSLDRKLIEAIKTALKLGYVHLDAAEVYNTEAEVGTAIQESKIDRKKLYITTKIMNGMDDIEKSIDQSLKKLKVDYVDLFLIHAPYFAKTDTDLQKAWATMETIQASGKARSIGVSNYSVQHLEATLQTAKVVPAINRKEIEFHPYLQHATSTPSLQAYHKQHKIALAAYGPLTAITKAAPGPVDDLLAGLAKKYYVTEGDICLRWCIEQNIVAVTTSSKESRLLEYLRTTKIRLTPLEVEEISRVGQEKHYRAFWENKFAADDRT